MDAMRYETFLFPKFPLDELSVIEVVVRQVQAARSALFRPAGFLIRAAFGTGFCVGRNFRATVRANLWGHYD